MSLLSVKMEDRISDLPDQLLTHILTLLPIEEAVRTGILSKRWIDVWTSMPILVFDDDHEHLQDFLTDQDFLLRDYKFLKFVNHVLFSRDTLPLDTFQLTWCSKFSETYPDMSKTLSFAASYMPKVLSITVKTKRYFNLPGSIFTCASIEEMYLAVTFSDEYDYFIEAESINLPRLKKLELHDMVINDDFLGMLLPGCPILEELVFNTCHFDIEEISSTVLKKLTCVNCAKYRNFQISCPNVVSLEIGFSNSEGITLENMPSLVTASLVLHIFTRNHDVKLLHGLSNVASLRLELNYLHDTQKCPIFNNLKSLDLRVGFGTPWNLVICLLQHSNNLKRLSLEAFKDFPVGDNLNFPILDNLKILALGVLDMKLHWNLVVSFLQHSPNLETLNLSFCWRLSSEVAAKEEFLGDVPFQLEYLERLNIICYKRNAKFAEEAVRRLSVFIKSIGEVIVDLR